MPGNHDSAVLASGADGRRHRQLSAADAALLQQLIHDGVVPLEILRRALRAFDEANLLGEIAVRQGLLTLKQVFEILGEQAESGDRFGEIAVRRGALTRVQLERLLERQARTTVSLADILIRMGVLGASDHAARVDPNAASSPAAASPTAIAAPSEFSQSRGSSGDPDEVPLTLLALDSPTVPDAPAH